MLNAWHLISILRSYKNSQIIVMQSIQSMLTIKVKFSLKLMYNHFTLHMYCCTYQFQKYFMFMGCLPLATSTVSQYCAGLLHVFHASPACRRLHIYSLLHWLWSSGAWGLQALLRGTPHSFVTLGPPAELTISSECPRESVLQLSDWAALLGLQGRQFSAVLTVGRLGLGMSNPVGL